MTRYNPIVAAMTPFVGRDVIVYAFDNKKRPLAVGLLEYNSKDRRIGYEVNGVVFTPDQIERNCIEQPDNIKVIRLNSRYKPERRHVQLV